MNKKITLLFFAVFSFSGIYAQDDLLGLLEKDSLKQKDYVAATFKATRIINGHSVETPASGVLQFMILHRFGALNSGIYELFGLDVANIRLGFDYGINSRLAVGIGRSGGDKTLDGYAKYKFLRQYDRMPLSLTFALASTYNFRRYDASASRTDLQRLTYTYQALIARKFSQRFSLQLSPTWIYRNLTESTGEERNVLALGIGGRFKLTKRLALTSEYYYVLPDQIDPQYVNVLSVGVDIETGGHVFQLHLTNGRNMVEPLFIAQNLGRWSKGEIYFGFNVSRAFVLKKKK
ncbi:MAG: hypothetical protein H7Y04_01960 [Verrucomicrobia bacterium]|nr:hypothetical protein [Cytophagales bacterium]